MTKRLKNLYIVGAGISSYAGLPLQSGFTKSLLQVKPPDSHQEILVHFLRRFINKVFDHKIRASSRYWPDLEDIFTCIDLSANTGHNLSSRFDASHLRTVRRALISRTIRMLDDLYVEASKTKVNDWQQLEKFFKSIPLSLSGFINLNWDTVVERGVRRVSARANFDYGSEADSVNFRGERVISLNLPKKRIPLIKMHGSVNWLYCDNCRRLFWFPPDKSRKISDQMLGEKDWEAIVKSRTPPVRTPPVRKSTCPHCNQVVLTTRLATFSYLKALDFSMFQRSWLFAEQLLRESKRWVFIGYSLPAADFEFKYLLKRVQLSRIHKPEFMLVTRGTEEETDATYTKYQRFLGRTLRRKGDFFPDGLSNKTIAAIS